MTLSLHFSVIEHEIFLAKKKWHHRMLKTELSFLSRKQLVLVITHAVNINTAVSAGSTYCPPPSSVSLLRSWSEILGCKVGPHFVATAYEFIHDQNTRRARASTPSVDGLYRDGTVHISREMHKQCFITRREMTSRAPKPHRHRSRTFL